MSSEAARSIAKNATVMMGSQAITWLSTFILMLFLPRYLGSEEYGRLYLALSVTMIFFPFIDFGGTFLIPKEVARARDQAPELLVNSIVMRILFWVVVVVLMVAFSFVAHYSSEVKLLILVLGISLLWDGVGKVLAGCYQGFEMMQYSARGNMSERVSLTAMAVVAVLLGAPVLVIAMIMALSRLINFLVLTKFVRRLIPHVPRFDRQKVFELVKIGAPFFLWSIFGMIYYRIDAVMLSLMTPASVVGWYGAAYRLFDALMFLPSIFSTALFPVLSRLWGKESLTLRRTTQKGLEFILLAGIPISMLVFALADQLVKFFFGVKEYGPTIPTLQMLSVGLLLVYIDTILGAALFASDKQRQWTLTALAAVFVNPVLNFFMIPYAQSHLGNGGIGAGLATLVTEFFLLIAAVHLVPKTIWEGASVANQFKILGAGILMAASLWILHENGVAAVLQAVITLAVYCFGLLSMKAVSMEELTFFTGFLSLRSLKTIFSVSGGSAA